MLLTIIQARLIKSGWRTCHRTVGYCSLILAAVVVVSGLQVLQTMILKEGGMVDGVPSTAIIPLEAALERTYLYGTPSLVPNFDVALYASVVTLIVLCAVGLLRGHATYDRCDRTGRVVQFCGNYLRQPMITQRG